MVSETELLVAVEAAFARTGRGLAGWPDPHPDRRVADEEYSRVTNPAKWRILGARVDAWLVALAGSGVADVARDVDVSGSPATGIPVTRADRVTPRADGALPLVVWRTRIEDVDDAGVVLGTGDPAAEVERFPDCGCDACDSGSQDELNELDRHLRSIVTGDYRRLTRGASRITAVGGGWSATGLPSRTDVDAILADPQGWEVLSGGTWLRSRRRARG